MPSRQKYHKIQVSEQIQKFYNTKEILWEQMIPIPKTICLKTTYLQMHSTSTFMPANTSDVKISSAEYLSGFRKEDKLIPIITLVIYFGADPWDAARSIYDMLSVQDQTLLSYIPDYKINLIAPFEMSDEEINQFSTNF